MSRFILIALFYLCTTIASAQTQSITEAKKAEVATLANKLCDTMLLQTNFGKSPHAAFERGILKYLGIDKENTPDYRAHVSQFWNQYHQYMICTNERVGYETPQHLLKRVIEMSSINAFYFDYFLEDESVNLNAIEWKKGEPETFVDYMDKIIADPNSKDIYDIALVRQLRGFAINTYNGKRACELLDGYHCPELR